MNIVEIELTKFRAAGLELYKEGKAKLVQSGFIHFLRIFSRPYTTDKGANPYSSAYSAAFTEGYNQCLDDIVYFEELHLSEKAPGKTVRPDFGGRALAMSRGDLTEKDLANGKR